MSLNTSFSFETHLSCRFFGLGGCRRATFNLGRGGGVGRPKNCLDKLFVANLLGPLL